MNLKTTQGGVVQTTEDTQNTLTKVPHVVIVGGGFGGLEAAKELGKQSVEVTLIDRNNFHLFQPMLYQVATGGLSPSDIATPIRAILESQQNTSVLMAEVTAVDTQEQHVIMEKQHIHYDYLILATGATSNYFGHPQWQQLAPSLKSLDDALAIRRLVFTAFEAAEREPDKQKRRALLTFVLVGGGPTGVELAGALAEVAHQALSGNFRHIDPALARIMLVQGPKRIMPGFPASLTQPATQKLKQLGVEVRTGVHVEDVTSTGVRIGHEYFPSENVIWTAGVKASPAGEWLHADVDHDGRVKVEPDLSVPGHPNIFVIGDTAYLEQHGKPLPGLAPVALQEAQYVSQAIANRTTGGTVPQQPFHYFDKGTLATVGRSFGIVNIGPLRFTGFLAWLTWLFVHILFLIGFRNRVLVLLQYAWTYFTYRRGARVILPEDHVRSPQ
ncbi:MAG: NAD(P)/FAD-dependent oxidoreductase [Chloroflexi bacterium]|nr:NAD(P)/FAD-dependent oxidoreductase [Chloroflexota bacterium]